MSRSDWIGHSTNLVGVPTGLLGSSAFNDYPVALHIAGTREMNAALFAMLDAAQQASDAADAFEKYMLAVFGEGTSTPTSDGKHRYRISYRRLLEDWGFDANGKAGAVLKGWVESRFGLLPAYHNGPIRRVGSRAWAQYVEEKMTSRYHNNSIYAQLDLLYEYAQWMIGRFFRSLRPSITLYRGTNTLTEHDIIAKTDRHHVTVRMNNLVSFSAERSIADCFGDIILETRVPAVKILFFRDLLPNHPLAGEAEFVVIGGDYQARIDYL